MISDSIFQWLGFDDGGMNGDCMVYVVEEEIVPGWCSHKGCKVR